ncbi:MAG: hypothetical protein JWP12_1335 [Bacteroidetes bacterium]|nr:hypothetical protein [Bacteroidota bacterium]
MLLICISLSLHRENETLNTQNYLLPEMKKLLLLLAVVFTSIVNAQTINVSSPNGGEIWAGCTVHNITWTSVGTSGFFSVDYSTNGGSTWTSLATNLAATSYSWTIPNTSSTNCLVRVFDYNTPATVDQSNAVFTITAPLILTSPNGGESWQVGGPTHNITWVATGTGANLTLEYSINAGSSWTTITTTAVASSGSYTWTIPNTPSNQCLVRIRDVATPCMTDASDNLFTIAPGTPTFTVTAPNTATTYYAFQTYTITWTSQYIVNPNVMIEYSTDNGTTWITIVASVANSGSYNWTVPNTPSNQCLVRVSEFGNPSANDVSNVDFTISSPVITVSAPNTALTYYVANTYTITWSNTTLSGPNVKLEYSIDNGASWITIIASTNNVNSYNWTVPNTPSTQCLVRVSDALTPAISDVSNVDFTIAPQFITVTSPNGSENYPGCSSQTITWTRGGTLNNAKIEYSLDGGATWTTIVASYNAGAGTSCSYTWGTVPNTPSTNCLIRVTDISIPTATDVSNGAFTISQNTAIIVNTPNGGEVWQVGGPTQNITWAAVGTSTNLTIQYSTDNGATWITITTTANAASGTYPWTIPNTPSTTCLVKIYDVSNTCKFDISNAVFTISPPTPVITVTNPNTALTYYVASVNTISWNSAYLSSSFVKIEYSIDNGATWISIVASVANSGSYSWTTPNTPSTQCLVRVSEFGNPVVNDISNVDFTIASPFITVTSPNTGTENWQGCSSQTITWNRGGTTNNDKIEYSLDGGATWITIVTSYNAGAGTSCSYTWGTVPNTPSTNCLIRVTDVSLPAATDLSNNPFTISQNTAIIVNTPNGGESWQVGGPAQNITWAAAGTSTNLTIQYSTDNGATWITITTTANAASGLYVWTIPNTPSSQCLVKIYDAANPCKFDLSNAVFTIAPPTEIITVTAPNTAVTYYVANTYSITWTSAYLVSSFVKLEYSIDNGASWITIVASVANSGVYNWTVPNTPSTQCLVRVSEFGTPAVNDISNVDFTIAPQFITVTSPNTGTENWPGCSTQTITWTRGGTTNNDKIDYSLDGGATWITLIASYNAGAGTSCSYSWAGIPNTPSTNCLVRVTDVSIPTATDISNNPFTISPNTSIIVTAPNGGENWQVGGPTQNITWAAVGTSTNLTIQYSINNGSTWTTITTTANAASGLYVWTIPNTPSNQCLVKIYDAANPCKFDISDALFTISPGTPTFTVTAPNTAVTYYALQTYTITWTSQYIVNPNVMIEYSINNGASWITIVSSVANSGSYNWTVPNTPSTQCLVRVSEFGNPSANDISNVDFTISSPVITVTAPNTALTYYVANTYTITWSNTTLSGPNVKLEYSIDNGASWITIVAATNNVNSYNWTVPNTPSTQCLVKVSDAASPATFDVSNVDFTIASQFIIVTSPNGGENFQGCSSQTITWNRGGTVNNAKIEYSLDGGATWTTIVASYNAGAGTSCSYTWGTVPNTPSTNCLIRVTDVSVPTATDVSNFPFSIIQNTAIIVNTPNGGEIWQVGGPTQNITWAAVGTSTNLTIQYSTDNGATWNTITTTANAASGTYPWTIPNTPSTQCLVKIFDASNTCKFDVSNATFTISPPTPVITVTAPNTAVTYYVANAYNINWTSAYLSSSFVKIEYSIDNGASWISIVASVANSGSYTWTVPNTPSTQCLVRVSEFGNPSVNDISNVDFTIAPQFITVTSPNGGENWQGCSTQTITWTRGGTTNNAKIEYSINGGTTWITLNASYNGGAGTTCSYTWAPIPNTPSTNCLVRVTDVSIPTATDISNTPFTIPLNTSIIVTAPNGGEVWQVGGPTQNITWAAVGTSTNLTIQYSTDNGATWTTITTTAVASSGLYNWTIPNTPGTQCLVRIYDAANPCKIDQSDAVFTILPGTPFITVTAPNTAVTYYVGSTYSINWNYAYLSSSFVKIEYSIDNGGTWIVISAAYTNTGSYSWTVPNTPSTQCLVRVSDYGNLSTNDISNVDFTIAPAIVVTAPNGGENLGSCTTTSINWTAGGCSGNYKLEYSINGGGAWTTIVASYAATTTGACSYTWTLPTTPSANCLVRVSDASVPTKIDQSNAVFTISPAITVTQPNFGGSYVVGSVLNITWTSSGVSNFYNIEYSTNGGSTWTTIVFNTNITTNTYAWTIPNAPSTNCLVRITDNVNTCKRDQSDVVFTITTTTPAITVTAPNGGENWQTCSTQNINWNASGTSGTYNLDYSTNGGSTWTSIITSYAAAGSTCSYAWSVPNTISSSCLVRVTDAVVGTRIDQSDAAFNITGLALTASGTATICNGNSTPLTASGTASYSWLPVTGLSATNISNPIANPSTTTTYTVTGTTGGCSNTATVTITVNPVPTVGVSPSTIAICTGGSTTLMASGAAAYTWLPATGLSSTTAPTVTAAPTGTTTYTVTGTTGGCAATATSAITVNPIPTVATSGSGTICNGASANLNATGATTYTWSPGTGLSSTTVANPTASPTTSITYTVSGTSLGCTATASVPVTVNPLPNISTSGNVSICLGSSAVVTASGATSYNWSPGAGLSNPNIANPSVSPAATTTYTITGTTAGCSNTTTVIVTVNPVPTVTATGTTTVCQGTSTPLTASGATTYSWSPAAGLSSTTSPTPTATPGTTTTYTVTGTSGGCTATATVTITVTPIPVVSVSGTTTICNGTSTNLTANGATNYSWLPTTGLSAANINNPVANPTATTTYTVTGSTGSCSATTTVTLTVNPIPNVTAIGTATVCAGTSTSLNASGAVTYVWTPATGLSNANVANPVATPATTTTYTVNGTSTGCSASTSVTVTVTPLPVISVSGTTGICSGGSTALTASGATTYSWAPATGLSATNIANPIASPTTTTTYTVSGTFGSCTGTTTVTITVNPIPVINVSGTTTICNGSSTSLSASGASTSYAWLPATGLSNASINNPVANPTTTTTYTVTGTSGGCSGSTTVTITVNPAPTVAAGGTATICSGTSTPLSASGATTYSWLPTTGLSSPTVANPNASPATTTTYTVTGTTAGCTGTATVTITVVPTPTVAATGGSTICAGSSATLNATGATTYSWLPATGLSNPNIANPSASPATTTTYTVTGTNGSCSNTATVTISVNPVPTVAATGTATICSGSSTPLSATGATTYSWLPTTGLSNASIANPTATPATTTTYTVTGTSLGCSASATVTITVNPTPTANAGSPATICLGSGGTTLNASGGTMYSWLPATGLSATNIANPTANPTSTTTYTVTVGNGSCSSTASVTVTVNTLPSVNAGSDASINCSGSATLSASGGTTYTWLPTAGLSNPNIANPIATPAATTSYTVTGTTGGCSGTDVVVVTVSPLTANAGPNVTICAGTSTTLGGSATGATTTYAWTSAQRFGSTGADRGLATAADAAGNQYITGTFNGTVTFGTFTLTSAGGYDTYIVKVSPAGTVLWAQRGGGASSELGNGIAVDPSGNVYVTGYMTTGSATFGSFTITSAGSNDVFLAKYNSTGTCQWALRAGGASSDLSNGIAADASGVWITGTFTGASVGFGSGVTISAHTATDEDLFVARYNSAGICQWAAAGGSSNNVEAGTGVSVDAAGNAYMTGYSRGTTTFGTFSLPVNADGDLLVVKYNSTGVCQWAKYGGSVGAGDYGRAIVTDGAGNSYVTGSIGGTSGFFGSLTTTGPGSDAFITKYNSAGVEQWAKAIGGTGADAFYGICLDPLSGNIYATGYSTSASVTIGSSVLTSFGASGQVLLGIFNSSGTGLFGIKSNSVSPGGDYAYGIGADGAGNAYITGTFNATGGTTATFGSTTLTSSGAGDAYIAKLLTTSSLSYAWSPATGLSSTTVASPTATPTSTTNYVLTVTSGSCTSSDTVLVTVAPAPTASVSAPATICSGSSTTLTATGGTTYSWLPVTGLSSPTVASPVASPTTTTTYTVTVSNGGSCTSTATVTITVNPAPVANAGSDVTIACGGSTTLGASGGSTYSWSPTAGLSNPNIANPVATPASTITYTVTVSNGSCSSTDAVVVTTGNLTANAGPDVTICSGNSTTLSGSSTGGSSTAWVNIATSYNYTQAVGTYTAITGGTVWLNGASTSMDDVVSGAVTIPSFTYNNVAYTTAYICTNGFISLGSTVPGTTDYNPISSLNTYAGGVISAFGVDLNKSTTGTPEIRYQTVGNEFIVQYQDMGRYASTGTLDRVSFQIRLNTVTKQINIVYKAPTTVGAGTSYPEIGLRGADNTFATNVHNRTVTSSTGPWVNSTRGSVPSDYCYFSSGSPTTIPGNGTTFTWSVPASTTTTYAWTPPTGLSSTTIANPVATPTTTTTYTLTATNGSCTAVDMVTVTVLSGSSVSAGADVAICGGGNTTLTATGGGTYLWAPATGLSATNIANPVATPTTTTTYTVTVSNGTCSFTDNVVVTVNPLPAQPSAITGSTTVCSGSTATYSITPVSGATSYTWTLPGGWTGTSTTPSITATATTTGGTISVVANNACGTGLAQTLAVNISTIPTQPVAITGATIVCQGLGTTYSVAAVSGATSYTWVLPSGWSGTSTTNSISATAGTTGGTISITANSSCGTSTAQTLAITVNPVPAQPAAISGNTSFCSGTSQTYSVTVDPSATSYTWSLPGGWSGTSTTNTINATAGTSSGSIIVTANNGCGSSTPQSLAVIVNSAPAQPSAMTGTNSICPGSAAVYSVTNDPSATFYSWTLPGGWSGSSISNLITATANTSGGTISVTANNGCGASTPQSMVININSAPVQPGAITGSTTICSGTNNTYAVATDPNVTNYVWSLPGGWSGTSTTNTISATANATSGTITVTPGNACGLGTAQTVNITVNTTPAQPAAITGTTTICEGTTQTYSVPADAAATGYTWTLPGDWSGTSSTETITATAGVMNGNIMVTADNACGSSTAQSVAVTVNPLPVFPVAITGNNTVCGASTQVYSVPADATATSFNWTLPGGWSGTSTTETISVTTNGTSGTISVYASNGCGNGGMQQLAIDVQSAPVQPTLVAADSIICDGAVASFQVNTDPNASGYTWTLPATWTGTSTTNGITTTATTNSGIVSVTENNACGTSTALNINVTVNPLPNVSLTSFTPVCDNGPAFTLSGGSPAGGTYSGTGVTGGTTFTPTTSGAGTFVITYTYSDANSCANNDTSNIVVDLCTGVAAANENNTVTVYPNPFIDYTTVSIGKSIQLNGTEIHIFDVLGKEVMILSNIHTYDVRVDRKDLTKGVYFYRLINDNKEISSGKLVVQ